MDKHLHFISLLIDIQREKKLSSELALQAIICEKNTTIIYRAIYKLEERCKEINKTPENSTVYLLMSPDKNMITELKKLKIKKIVCAEKVQNATLKAAKLIGLNIIDNLSPELVNQINGDFLHKKIYKRPWIHCINFKYLDETSQINIEMETSAQVFNDILIQITNSGYLVTKALTAQLAPRIKSLSQETKNQVFTYINKEFIWHQMDEYLNKDSLNNIKYNRVVIVVDDEELNHLISLNIVDQITSYLATKSGLTINDASPTGNVWKINSTKGILNKTITIH